MATIAERLQAIQTDLTPTQENEILALIESGDGFKEIAMAYGVTWQRVMWVARKAGLPRRTQRNPARAIPTQDPR